MARYTGIPCPVCGSPFSEDDDVVVCPECGTPQHRSCYLERGGCINAEKHAEGFSWEPPAPAPAMDPAVFSPDEILRCPRCGAKNPPGQEQCEVCGTPLQGSFPDPDMDPTTPPTYGYDGTDPTSPGQAPGPGGPFIRVIPLDAYMNPLGGLSPEETIDGIPVTEMAMFVGTGSPYYLPRFKALEQHQSAGFHWSGAVISLLFFLYRKVYLFAAISLVLSLCLSLPSSYFTAKAWTEAMAESGIAVSAEEIAALSTEELETQLAQLQQMDALITAASRTESYAIATRLQSAASLFKLGISLFFGFFATRIYKGHVVRTIRKLKAKYPDPKEYKAMLVKRGGVNRMGAGIFLGGYLLLNLLSAFLIAFL